MDDADKAQDLVDLRNQHGDDFADLYEAVQELFPAYERDPTSLSPLQQAVVDTWVLDGVVGNGGFDSRIVSNGHRADTTVHGLREVVDALDSGLRTARSTQ